MKGLLSRMRPTEILGFSHLVLPVSGFENAENVLSQYGYSQMGSIDSKENPLSKTEFIKGTLSSTFSMRLLKGPRGTQPIELLREDHAHTLTKTNLPDFEAIFSPNNCKLSIDELGALLHETTSSVLAGFKFYPNSKKENFRSSVVVHTYDLNQTRLIWDDLGFTAETLSAGILKINVRSAMPGQSTDVFIIQDRKDKAEGFLNATGIVCISFFCQDADRLASHLSELGYAVGQCFTLSPFGRFLRVFFVRNKSGELYEFLSIAPSQN